MKNTILETLLKEDQKTLYAVLKNTFKKNVLAEKEGKYLLIKGESPVMLVAHLDTVHKETVRVICYSEDGNTIMSPQGIGGDDRCGVYALVKAWAGSEKKPYLLFTCDEEIGCIGAKEFADDYMKTIPALDVNFIVEIDRRGKDDSVYYNCDNEEFEDFITDFGFITNYGSYSDICEIAPAVGVAAVNLSSGYFNEHTLHEYIRLDYLEDTVEKVKNIVKASEDSGCFKWKEMVYTFKSKKGSSNFTSYGWDEYEDYFDWRDYYDTRSSQTDRLFGMCGNDEILQDMVYELLYEYDADDLIEVIEKDGKEGLKELYTDTYMTDAVNYDPGMEAAA